MRPDLHSEISRRLLLEFGFKERGAKLERGKCPSCGEKELWTYADTPWVLRCNRQNSCGAELSVRDLYRDVFESWSDRFRSDEKRPHAAADAYLEHGRGFPLARLRGLYSQEWYQDRDRGIGTATVRFPLECGSWWERLIDRPERFGKQKARFAPGKPYKGRWWAMPDTAKDATEIWLTEGVFDAIALELAGKSARGLLSCNNYPADELAALAKACHEAERDRPVLVWALDGDKAGRKWSRIWVDRARQEGWHCRAAQIPMRDRRKLDWNDAHLRGALTERDFDEYLYQGDLLLAETAMQKALLMYKRTEKQTFHFGHQEALYWFKLDVDRYNKAREAISDNDELSDDEKRDKALEESGCVTRLANCYPTALYYQANALTDEAWYYFRVTFPHGGPAIKNTFTSGQLASAAEFKKRLAHVAPGGWFTGTTPQLDRIFGLTLDGIKRVETIDFIGYTREHGCYVLGDLAVKDGQVYTLNEEDFFELPKLSIKSLNQSIGLVINRDREEYRRDWLQMLWECFGAKGMVALAFWFGSLFAEQIRASQKSYPFLEMIGEAGSGKSTLLEFLWKLVGRRDYEGFDPSKSTLAARARNFAQVSNLPIALIEADRETDTAKQRSFDWEELKTAYNGRSIRSTGVKNAGNETREPPFRGTIVITQNAEVSASDAILQRIVHLRFDKAAHTPTTKMLAEQLERMPLEDVSGFVLQAIQQEAKVLEIVEGNAATYADKLIELPSIKSVRIAKNHGQIMALVDAMRGVVGLTDQQHAATHELIAQLAVDRQHAINADHPSVVAFWELFEHLDANLNQDSLNHSANTQLIALSLVEIEERASKRGLRMPVEMTQLKALLRGSRSRRFVDVKTVTSKVTHASKKCWVFEHAK